MNRSTQIKRGNSKRTLADAVVQLQNALAWYAKEEHWAVKEDDILWLGDEDPPYRAQVILGQRKPDPKYMEEYLKFREEQKRGDRQGAQEETTTRDRGGNEVLEQQHLRNVQPEVREGQDGTHTDPVPVRSVDKSELDKHS